MKKLKVLVWNLQDLFIFLDKYQNEDLQNISEARWQLLTASFVPNKVLTKVKAIADLINRVKPDICLFSEVGGIESLQNLNTHFLSQQFDVFCEKSNSDRGIDLGVLTRKNLSLATQINFIKQKIFARGVYHLTVKNNNKKIQFLLTHLKSKLSKDKDFEGSEQRTREVSRLVKHYKSLSSHHKYPLFICGDLNGSFGHDKTDPELAKFATNLGLEDAFSLLERENFERSSYLYYNEPGDVILMQLDYFLVHPSWKELISQNSHVLDFDGGKRETIPASRDVKLKQPSDHYPLYIELDLENYW